LEYLRASGIDEAAAAVAAGAKPLAGGTVLVPNLAANGGRGQMLVDIGRLKELARIWSDDTALYLGATSSLARIAVDAAIRSNFQALAEAAAAVGNPQVRRAATIGGNVALGSATADLVPALLVLDAQVICHEKLAKQEKPLAGFDATGRLITSLRLPLIQKRRSAFHKFAWRGASGITIVNVAIAVCLNESVISQARVVAGGLTQPPQRLPDAEATLNGREITPDVVTKTAAAAAAEAKCELNGPPGEHYRRRILEYGTREILRRLMEE